MSSFQLYVVFENDINSSILERPTYDKLPPKPGDKVLCKPAKDDDDEGSVGDVHMLGIFFSQNGHN